MTSIIGEYGDWAANLAARRPAEQRFTGPLREHYRKLLLQPDSGGVPIATAQHHLEFDGLAIEHLTWQLPYGPPTEAVLLKPLGSTGKLPGILAFHDHGGNKFFGTQKIATMSKDPHPAMVAHQARYYGGRAWANELARRGYVVLVADAFTFGSRRVRMDPDESDPAKYNVWASVHEHVLSKSLFSAGTTWPGVFTGEDQRALDYLCSRPDVDAARVGCGGLSGGGLRTVYLSGLDARIRCSCVAGMMTTWRDFVLNKAQNHTWMVYIPGLPLDLDYPGILALNAPNPALVMNNSEDTLFTLAEMERADRITAEAYRKAGATDQYQAKFYPGPHKFDRDMQADAFAWFDKWLKL